PAEKGPGRGSGRVAMSSPVESILDAEPGFDPARLGLAHPGRVHANLSAAALVEHAIRRRGGVLTDFGALSAFTGTRPGRSPGDKFTVKDAASAEIDWTANRPMDPEVFARLRDLVRSYLQNRELFVFDGFACADPRYRLPLRVVTE